MSGPSATAGQGSRRRDAQASRDAILRAARVMFARHAYTDITLKAVAELAGVSAPLIVKYFGNKERLFAHILSFEEDADALLDAPLEELGRHMVVQLLTSQAERATAPVLRIAFAPLHSSHGEYGEVLRANFRRQVVARLTERLTGPDAAVRAELALSMLLGLGIMYGIARGDAVRAANIDDLADRYAPALQDLLSGNR
ncbi:TetR/AcrR family transcriptional regulator [Streptomyces jeddahensis]|uniref:Transcriptional regulator BetI n=1 Tax=Streptomyces jeddahensis TaxID=1716141 RepID=A0A177HNZ4_9ACTN|nr:TetR family transcriptional regulator [Streptomyces jeddahensis]OAH12732.1 transcriptional regulator BetI [Streptomyces jeddahensis]